MSSLDEKGAGIVSKRQFDEILRANGVFVSNEELKLLFEKFGDNSGKNVNYVQVSEVLGLTTVNLNLMRATHSKINRLKAESRQGVLGSMAFAQNIFRTNNQLPAPVGVGPL